MRIVFILAVVGLLFVHNDVLAQRRVSATPQSTPTPQQESDSDIVRITTNLVQIDAVVTKDGRPVSDLTADDFEIREDGRPQKITNLSFIPTSNSNVNVTRERPANKLETGPPVRLKAAEVRRTVALVVDDLCLTWSSTVYVRRALRKFVDNDMQPGDLVAIMRTAGSVGILQQFTADKKQLYAAIERVQWSPRVCNRTEAFDQLNEDLQLPAIGVGPESNAAIKSSGKLDSTKNLADVNSRGMNSNAEDFRGETITVGTLGALSHIVRGLKDLPGRKAVLFISDGFRLIDKSDHSRSDNVDPSYTRRILEAIQRVADLASRSSVVVYTLDARGLVTSNFTAADRVSGSSVMAGGAPLMLMRAGELNDTQAGLNYLAQQAGGFAIYNTNDFAGGIKRVFEDQSGYYLIGYRPDESTFDSRSGPDKFHKISVKVKRPGVAVRTRTGFYGVSEEALASAPVSRAQHLVKAVISPFNANDLDVRLTSVFINDATSGSFLRSLLHIDPHDLTFTKTEDGWQQTVLDVFAVTFGDNGEPLDQYNKTETIRMRGATYEQIRREGLVYFLNVPVKKAGAYQFRIAVRDNGSSKIGSASQFVEVPDIKKRRLALSGLVISGQETASTKKADFAIDTAADGGEEINPQASAAVRRFHPGMVLKYALVVYNPQLDKSTRQPQVELRLRLFRDGKAVLSGEPQLINTSQQPDLTRILAGGGFKLGTDLGPGDYYLQVIVRDRLAKARDSVAAQWIDFQIVK